MRPGNLAQAFHNAYLAGGCGDETGKERGELQAIKMFNVVASIGTRERKMHLTLAHETKAAQRER